MGKNRKSWPRECCLGGETLKVKNFEPDSWQAICWSFDACCCADDNFHAYNVGSIKNYLWHVKFAPRHWMRLVQSEEINWVDEKNIWETKAAEKTQRFLSFSVEKDTNICRWRLAGQKAPTTWINTFSLLRLIKAAASGLWNKKLNWFKSFKWKILFQVFDLKLNAFSNRKFVNR